MSDAEWDKEDYEPPTVAKKPVFTDKWDGEDEDEIKDNWDDEESKENDDGTIRAIQPKKKKPLAQIIAEKEEKRRLELEEKMRMVEEREKELSPEEKLAEKLKMQKLQEESDLELAKEAFGLSDLESASKEELDEYKNSLVTKILQQQKSPHFVSFLDDFFRELVVNLEAQDIKKLSSTLTAVAIEKGKKNAAKSKAKNKKKAALNIGKGNSGDLALESFDNEYEDFI